MTMASWKNKIEGEGGSEESFASRDEAIAARRALDLERTVEHIVRREDGTVGERNAYSHDPHGAQRQLPRAEWRGA